MVPVTIDNISGGDSDLSDVLLGDKWDVSTPRTRNTAAKQKSSSGKPTTRISARNHSQGRGKLALKESPARSTRPPITYTMLSSSTSVEVFPYPSTPSLVSPASRKRKTRPSEIPIDTTPAKRKKKQERSLFDGPVGAVNQATTPGRHSATAFSIGFTPTQSPSRQQEWNFRMLQDTQVFVKLLRTDGSPAASDALLAEIYWWPARSSGPVTLSRISTRLYGDDGYGRNRTVCLPAVLKTTVHTLRPSERNRLYRFTAHDFTQPPIPSDLQESFKSALQEAIDDDDDEPLDLDAIRRKSSQTREHVSSPVHPTISEQDESDHWEPPPPPESLMIPGEPVLCRGPRSDGHTTPYWPAKIVKYIPPKSRKDQGKYEVHFFDRKTAKVSRHQFFTCFEEGFSSCTVDLSKLHMWHTMNGANESLFNKRTPPGTRLPSPEPLVPLSDDGIPLDQNSAPHKPFTQLTPREQLACLSHVLQLILLDKYEPTQELNMAWMAGGKSRQAVQFRAGMKGNLTDNEGSILVAQVRRWALREERWASDEERKALEDAIQDVPIDILQISEDQNTDVQDIKPPLPAKAVTTPVHSPNVIQRPRGSAAYESLCGIDRSGYIMDVLIPEAIAQLLLWRNGDRTTSSPGPLRNPQDEAKLREKGLKMRDESETQSAWIDTVVQAWKATRKGKEVEKSGRPTRGRGAVEE